MPDLSLDAAQKFWSDYEDPIIYRVISFMEGVEEWTKDGDSELEAALKELGDELEDIRTLDLNKFGNQEYFIQLACHLKSSRALRMLQAIDTVHPGSASKLLIHAEESSQNPEDPAGLFLRRNIVFERLRLLARVFSEQRFNLILKALEGE